jgi:tripartite-type tricarboxylate transporter receptor subunit TctC
MMFVDVLTGLPHVKAGALEGARSDHQAAFRAAAQLPSMDEAGVKGFDITSWQGYLGPANLPRDIVTKLNAEIRKIVETPSVKNELAERGMDLLRHAGKLRQVPEDQLVVWEKLIRDAKIEKQ